MRAARTVTWAHTVRTALGRSRQALPAAVADLDPHGTEVAGGDHAQPGLPARHPAVGRPTSRAAGPP
ncbi:hypothetical protein GCM10010259_09800 [Streptomyces daghestanicus]|nr:hypothetical protein GCM10010259_09800 [Streptomyces daghestanicus]